jgi:hypothetical protein
LSRLSKHDRRFSAKADCSVDPGDGLQFIKRSSEEEKSVHMITKVVIERKEIFADGHEFPVTGAYEKLVGKVRGEVDPKNPLNKVIVNLDKAPTNSRRRVEYWADLYILKPMDMERGNKKIFLILPIAAGSTFWRCSTMRRQTMTQPPSKMPATAFSCVRVIPSFGEDGMEV